MPHQHAGGAGRPGGRHHRGQRRAGQFGYSGITGSATSQQALANPFSRLITIENGFLSLSPLLLDKSRTIIL
jgi:hypothetical protein